MLNLLGSFLIISSAGGIGLREALRIRRISRDADTALRLLSRMETLILFSHAPLPQLLRRLREEMPSLFPSVESEPDTDASYSDVWSECVRIMPLDGSVCLPLRQLGESIFSGCDPASAIGETRGKLKAEQEEALRKWREYGKLYSTLGFVIGCFLVILLA